MKKENSSSGWRRVFEPITSAFLKFIDSRTPTQTKVTLSQNRIYIIPSKYGVVMLWVIAALLLAGINYSNSIILSLGYLLISFFVVAILHTYRNLSGLTIESSHVQNGFVEDTLLFEISFSRTGERTYERVTVIWEGVKESVSLVDNREAMAQLLIPADKRGYLQPGRVRIETNYPVGLFTCWSYARFNVGGWAYPKPVKNTISFGSTVGGGDHEEGAQGGTDDFHGLRRYQVGDSLKQVDWKAYAKEEKLYTKVFIDTFDQDLWIDWRSFSGIDQERLYSYICYWVLKLSEQNRYFGVRLPYFEIELGRGEEHKVRCLIALAQA